MYVGGSQSVRHRDKYAAILFCKFADTGLLIRFCSHGGQRNVLAENRSLKISINVIGAKNKSIFHCMIPVCLTRSRRGET